MKKVFSLHLCSFCSLIRFFILLLISCVLWSRSRLLALNIISGLKTKPKNCNKNKPYKVYWSGNNGLYDNVQKTKKLYMWSEAGYRGMKATCMPSGHTGRGQHLPGSGSSMWHTAGSELQSWHLQRKGGKNFLHILKKYFTVSHRSNLSMLKGKIY